MRRVLCLGVLASALSLLACHIEPGITPDSAKEDSRDSTPAVEAPHPQRDLLTQVSTIGILSAGGYYGWSGIDSVSENGDFGLGTFEHLDGEMVQAGGVIYQVKADGSVQVPAPSTGTPFFVTTYFDVDQVETIGEEVDFHGLQEALERTLPSHNQIYAIRVVGRFDYLKTRSVPAQNRPYPPLAQVVQSQPTFEFTEAEGTLVGFYFPKFFSQLNVPGFHFHFVTADSAGGGHVLELRASGLRVEIDDTSRFQMILPETNKFREFESVMSDE